MYINVAYSYDQNPDLEDLSIPLRINNCGYYCIHTTPVVETTFPKGRNDYQLLYIASGKGHFYFEGNGKETIVSKGNMVLFKPGEPQVYRYYAADKTEVYWVHFTGSHVEEYIKYYELPGDNHVFFTGASPDYPWIFNQIISELQVQRVNYEEMLRILLHHIFITINRYIKECKQVKHGPVYDIERAARYFKENYNSEISIERYAIDHLMSVNKFINTFKNIMKVTPMQYIISLRISAAKVYFDSTNKNVTEVADAVGYDNPLYFSRVFKKHTGFSPREYKKMMAKNISQ